MQINTTKEFLKIEKSATSSNMSLGDRQKMYERIFDLKYDALSYVI